MIKSNHKYKNFMMAIEILLILLLSVNIGMATEINSVQQSFGGVSAAGNIQTLFLDTPRIGGVSISVIPRSSNVSVGETLTLNIKAKNTQNIRDIFKIYISLDNIPSVYRPDINWFEWSNKNVYIRSGRDITIPLDVTIPGNASGIKIFRVRINSTTSARVYAYDTGYLKIT